MVAHLSLYVHQLGHYGAALLIYAPIGALVYPIAPGLALLGGWRRPPAHDAAGLRPPGHARQHRGPTHTLLFLLVVAGALGAAGWVVATRADIAVRPTLAAFACLVGVLGIGSHLLADALTPMGVEPFWPVSSRNVTLGLTRSSNAVANWVLFALGVFVTVTTLLLVTRVG